MEKDNFVLKYNVELFAINLAVNRAKSEGLNSVSISSPVFKIEYNELNSIAEFLVKSNKYKTVETDFNSRRNAYNTSGKYSEKTITLHWE